MSEKQRFMEAAGRIPTGKNVYTFLGSYPGKMDLEGTLGGPVAIYPNGGESGLLRHPLDVALRDIPENALSEADYRRAAETVERQIG